MLIFLSIYSLQEFDFLRKHNTLLPAISGKLHRMQREYQHCTTVEPETDKEQQQFHWQNC